MNRFDTVVFDLGGVLIDWNPRHLYRKLFDGRDAEMEQFLATVCTMDWHSRQDAGERWAEAVEALQREHPDKAELIAAFYERWEEMFAGPIQGTVDILGELRDSGITLFALTNWSHELFPLTRSRFPFLDWFEGIVVSGEEKMIKPDHRIFALLASRYDLVPGRTMFIDDNAANVDAAREFGLRAIRFTEPAALRRELQALGLL